MKDLGFLEAKQELDKYVEQMSWRCLHYNSQRRFLRCIKSYLSSTLLTQSYNTIIALLDDGWILKQYKAVFGREIWWDQGIKFGVRERERERCMNWPERVETDYSFRSQPQMGSSINGNFQYISDMVKLSVYFLSGFFKPNQNPRFISTTTAY